MKFKTLLPTLAVCEYVCVTYSDCSTPYSVSVGAQDKAAGKGALVVNAKASVFALELTVRFAAVVEIVNVVAAAAIVTVCALLS